MQQKKLGLTLLMLEKLYKDKAKRKVIISIMVTLILFIKIKRYRNHEKK